MLCEYFILVFVAGSSVRSTIAGQPPLITNFLEDDLLLPGDVEWETGFRLPCRASGTKPVYYSWRHNDYHVVYGAQYQLLHDGTLQGVFLNHSSDGEYQCFARNEFGEAFSRKIQVNVTIAGLFYHENDKIAPVTLGKPIEIPCPKHGPSFGVTYRWGNRDSANPSVFRTFDEDDRVAVTMDGTLVIMFVTFQDVIEINAMRGVQCEMSTATESEYSHSVKFQPRGKAYNGTSPPQMYDTPNANEEAREGLDKKLYCLAVGKPAPYIDWEKDGQRITDGEDHFKLPAEHHNRLLIIRDVEKEEHEGVYTCTATSRTRLFPAISAKTLLTVKVSPELNVTLPPKLTVEWLKNERLKCMAWGDPAPRYRWYRNGQEILYSDTRVKLQGNVLKLTKVVRWHEAVFQCVAENNQGMDVSSTWVHVFGEGPPPTVAPSSPAGQGRVAVEWIVVPVVVGLLLLVLIIVLVVYCKRRKGSRPKDRTRASEESDNNAFDESLRGSSITRLERGPPPGATGLNRPKRLPAPLPQYESLDSRTVQIDLYEQMEFEQDPDASGLYESLDFRNTNSNYGNNSYQKPGASQGRIPDYLELVSDTDGAAKVNPKRPGNEYLEPIRAKGSIDVEQTSPTSRGLYEPMGGQDVNGSGEKPSFSFPESSKAAPTEELNRSGQRAVPSSPAEYYVPMAENDLNGPERNSQTAPEYDVLIPESDSKGPEQKSQVAPDNYVPMAENDSNGPKQKSQAAPDYYVPMAENGLNDPEQKSFAAPEYFVPMANNDLQVQMSHESPEESEPAKDRVSTTL